MLWRKVGEECCGERSVGEECPQGRLLQRFAVAVELTLRLQEMLDALRVGVKKNQRIQNRSLLLICIRVRGLFGFYFMR